LMVFSVVLSEKAIVVIAIWGGATSKSILAQSSQDGFNVCRWLPCRGCSHPLRAAEPPFPCARKDFCRQRTRSDQLSQGGPPCLHASWGARPGSLHVDVAALCAAIRVWTIGQIPNGAADLEQLVCDAKTLRSSIEPTAVAALR
jgi:hypothetical protein